MSPRCSATLLCMAFLTLSGCDEAAEEPENDRTLTFSLDCQACPEGDDDAAPPTVYGILTVKTVLDPRPEVATYAFFWDGQRVFNGNVGDFKEWDTREIGNQTAQAEVRIDIPGEPSIRASQMLTIDNCGNLEAAWGPGFVDVVDDGMDFNCDGHDGEDADMDSTPSVVSGGDDCDDDDPSLGSCASQWGMSCSEAQCVCDDEECSPGDWTAGGVPGHPLTAIMILPEDQPAWDLDGDGEADNTFTPVFRNLFDGVGVDLDEQFDGAIKNGELSLAAVPFAYDGRVDLPSVSRSESGLMATASDIHPNEAIPRSRLSGLQAVEDGVYEGDGGFLRVPFPMGRRASIPVPIHVRKSRVEILEDGTLQGQIGGYLTGDEFVVALNEYFASEQCTCLEGDRRIERRPGHYVCPTGSSRACEGRCGTVFNFCGLILPILLGQAQMDIDGDGEGDAGGIHLLFETSGPETLSP